VIHHVDKALEAFLRQQVPLPESDVDLSFRAPESSWTASIARPTVDVFLFDIARSARSSVAGRDERVSENGRRQQRPQPQQVALRYFITVWAREQRDEHELLGAILRAVLGHSALPSTLLPPSASEGAWRLSLAGDQHRLPPALWGGAPIKPGVYIDLELGVDAAGWTDRGLPVEELRLGVSDRRVAAPEPGASAADAGDAPPLRRVRSGGAVVMEGRPVRLSGDDDGEGAGPGGAGPGGAGPGGAAAGGAAPGGAAAGGAAPGGAAPGGAAPTEPPGTGGDGGA